MAELYQVRNVINGEFLDSIEGQQYYLIDPSTGAVFANAPLSTKADVDKAYKAAAEAFNSWLDTTQSIRQKALLKLADVFEEHADELVELESKNTGKPIPVTTAEEIPPMLDQIRFFAGAARVLEGK